MRASFILLTAAGWGASSIQFLIIWFILQSITSLKSKNWLFLTLDKPGWSFIDKIESEFTENKFHSEIHPTVCRFPLIYSSAPLCCSFICSLKAWTATTHRKSGILTFKIRYVNSSRNEVLYGQCWRISNWNFDLWKFSLYDEVMWEKSIIYKWFLSFYKSCYTEYHDRNVRSDSWEQTSDY